MDLVYRRMSTPTSEQLKRAIKVSQQIQQLEAELAAILGGSKRGAKADLSVSPPKRNMSPEARERIAAAQRARWAKFNKEKKKAQKGE